MKSENHDGLTMIETTSKDILKEDYDNIRNYFINIVNKKYDCIIFISRRCFVLYLMFCVIGGWVDEVCTDFCTDLGIYSKRDILKNCKKVIVIDDIGYTGASMKGVLNRVKQYVPLSCKIDAALYAFNKQNINHLLKIKVGRLRYVNVKGYCQLTDRQCQALSIKLVSSILATGMPYTTFVYPVWGKEKSCFSSNNYKEFNIENKGAILNDYKWKTSYVLNINNTKCVSEFGSFQCVRIYRQEEKGYIYFVPFVFLRSIKIEKVNLLYSEMANTFKELGKSKIADEIISAINVKKTWRKDAIEYLTCVLSSFCSKALAETLDVQKYVDNQLELDNTYLKSSFSEEISLLINNCDKKFINLFFESFLNKVKGKDIFIDDKNENDFDDREISYLYYNKLSRYITSKEKEFDTAFNMLCIIFEWMKEEGKKNIKESKKIQTILLSDLLLILKWKGHFSDNDIYIAQIECWDRGIATYRFSYDSKVGIVASCGVGEMSSNITALKYQKLVREYFKQKILYDEEMDTVQRKEIIDIIIKNAEKNQEYTIEELEQFREIFAKRQGSLYGLLI